MSQYLDQTKATTDLSEMVRQEFVRSLAAEFDARLPSLFPETHADLRKALGALAGGDSFATLARRFFAGLTHQTLAYYLSRTLTSQTGSGARFASDAERVSFERALASHAWETAAIVED